MAAPTVLVFKNDEMSVHVTKHDENLGLLQFDCGVHWIPDCKS